MTIRLTIRTAIWRSHVARIVNAVADARPDQSHNSLVPVVKGNGYGFGRTWLAEFAAEFADTVAVGTVHELVGLPDSVTAVVLTPTLSPPAALPGRSDPILTVGSAEHIDALHEWQGRVIVKLDSPMRRFGGDVSLVATAEAAGLDVVGISIHPPLAGSEDDHVAAITQRLAEDMMIRNLADATIDAYTYHVRRFADFIEKPLDRATVEDVRNFQLYLIRVKKVAYSSFNQAVCALRFFYRHTQPMPWPVTMVPFGKRPKTLPTVLSRHEVDRLLQCTPNLKHRTFLMVLYSAGDSTVRLPGAVSTTCLLMVLYEAGTSTRHITSPVPFTDCDTTLVLLPKLLAAPFFQTV